MFDALRVGDGARFTVESKNDLLEGTHEIATEAIQSWQSPSRTSLCSELIIF